jgi:hypothetical protein
MSFFEDAVILNELLEERLSVFATCSREVLEAAATFLCLYKDVERLQLMVHRVVSLSEVLVNSDDVVVCIARLIVRAGDQWLSIEEMFVLTVFA